MPDMRMIEVGGCEVHILPIIKGLVSECDKVREAMSGGYDVIGLSAGPEDIVGYERRQEILDENGVDLSDLEIVYSHFLMQFGKVEFPTPAYSLLVDMCRERSIGLVPLDMDDEMFSDLYCNTVTTMELLKETKLAKKLYKRKFDMSSPESFVTEWDDQINRIRGLREMSVEREDFIGDSIRKSAEGRRRMLAVVDYERADGIEEYLTGDSLDL